MAIFESTDRGATKVFDEQGCILSFNRQNLNLITNQSGEKVRINMSDSWICYTEDEDLIARAKKHKDFTEDKSDEFYKTDKFRIIDKVPVGNRGSIIKGVDGKEMIIKAIRFGMLKNELINKDGSYSKSATPELIEEYETLKTQLE